MQTLLFLCSQLAAAAVASMESQAEQTSQVAKQKYQLIS